MKRKSCLAGYLRSLVFSRVGAGLAVLLCVSAIDSARSQGLIRDQRLEGDPFGERGNLGRKVALGDLNGDGLADLVVADSRRTYIYYRNGDRFGNTFGNADVELRSFTDFIVANVNGDAFKDLVTISGNSLSVYHGRSAPFTDTQTSDWTWQAPYSYGYGSIRDLSVLDVYGDGFDDIIISSTEYKEYPLNPGHYYFWGTAAYIFYGSSTGLPADHSPDATIQDCDEAGDNWVQPDGPDSDPWASEVWFWLSNFGEVSRDGTILWSESRYDQFAVGAPSTAIDVNKDDYIADGERYYGAVWVGPRSQALLGDRAYYSRFGSHLGSVGDVNGDGLNDLLAGDLGTSTLGRGPKAFLYLGKSDANMTVMKREYSWSVAVDRSGNPYTLEFGYQMGSVGDINGDGFGDMVITDPRYDNIGGRSQAEVGWWGGAFIWYGGPPTVDNPSGLRPGGSPAGCDLRLPSIGDAGNCGDFGRSYAFGDINGDGFSDVVFGAPRWAYGGGNNTEIGAVFVYLSSFGRAQELSVSTTSLLPVCIAGQDAAADSFEVWNSGGGTLSYTISESLSWLNCTPTTGTSRGEQDTITVNYTTAGLPEGSYNGTITVTAPGATGSPKTINVKLGVGSGLLISLRLTRGNTLSFSWTGGPGIWLEKSLRPQGAVWTPVPGSEGISHMELPLTDSSAFFRVAANAPSGSITQQPRSLAVAQGNAATFSVVASGTPAPSYQWRLNGVNISGANNSTCSISSVQPSHVGDYTVVVSFGSLAVTSSPANLVILAPYGHLVWIPAGTFVMGSPVSEVGRGTNEGPQTTVTLSRGYWMGTYEVTQQEYINVMGSNPSHFTSSLDQPVEFLSWTDATNYCSTLTQIERAAGRIPGNFAYRLPTEAEWEYACRAGTTTRFSYGDDPDYANLATYAWYTDNSGATTHPVGGKLPNPWGLYDMHGNVWEWCQDWLAAYPGGSVTDPVVGPPTGSNPIVRGGSYYYDGTICRSAKRGAMNPPTGMRWDVGLRAVLVRTGP